MPELVIDVERLSLVIEIGGMAVRVNTTDREFLCMLQRRYAGFLGTRDRTEVDLDVELSAPGFGDPEAAVRVRQRSRRWLLERGDFYAEWEPASRKGSIRQSGVVGPCQGLLPEPPAVRHGFPLRVELALFRLRG